MSTMSTMSTDELLSKATARPWFVAECEDGVYAGRNCRIVSTDGEIVGVRQLGYKQADPVEANAELIVRATNSFEAMREVIEEAADICACEFPGLDQNNLVLKLRKALALGEGRRV